MKRMPKLVQLLTVCILSAASCAVHEFPVPEKSGRSLELHLEFETGSPLWKTLELDSDGNILTRAASQDIGRRYLVRAFYNSKGPESRVPVKSWEFLSSATAFPDTTVTLTEFPEGAYRILVWSDFGSGGADWYYNTDDFTEIVLSSKDNYQGSTDWRDAFRGDVEIDGETDEALVAMVRPMAKFEFVSTDLEHFIEDIWVKSQLEKGADVRSSDFENLPEHIKEAELQAFGVRFIYPMYMACSFNMFTNRPANSWPGVTYETSIVPMDTGMALMGFDYVFVNSHDTSINVSLEVFEKRGGQVVARVNALDVPLRRSHLTVVQGPFLTARAGGAPSIDPSFDGEFNIEIK